MHKRQNTLSNVQSGILFTW